MALFGLVIFAGYFLIGALFFKVIFSELSSGELTRISDRLVYDRYAICGCGIPIFLGLYGIFFQRRWIRWKSRVFCVGSCIAIFAVFFKKAAPLVEKYPGYIYNTIILGTFQKLNDPYKIMWGERYSHPALLYLAILALLVMTIVLILSCNRRRSIILISLTVLILGEFALIHVNYVKIRKATNDYVVEATEQVVEFIQNLDRKVMEEFPFILKGGTSGNKIQYYQSQLMESQMFGKKQIEETGSDNFFIISEKGDVDMKYDEGDYYLFDAFDYDNADTDIVYIKGEKLKNALEQVGYVMIPYQAGNEQ